MKKVEDGYCGLYCGACMLFLKTINGEIEEFAAENGLPVSDFACYGCKSEQVAKWCRECNLKDCSSEKGLDNCGECNEYPCDDLVNFRDDPQYPYHIEITEYLEEISNKGKEAWLRSMEKRWSCKECGEPYGWYQLSCNNCKAAVDGYEEPSDEE